MKSLGWLFASSAVTQSSNRKALLNLQKASPLAEHIAFQPVEVEDPLCAWSFRIASPRCHWLATPNLQPSHSCTTKNDACSVHEGLYLLVRKLFRQNKAQQSLYGRHSTTRLRCVKTQENLPRQDVSAPCSATVVVVPGGTLSESCARINLLTGLVSHGPCHRKP